MTKVLEFPKSKVVREVPEEQRKARKAKMEQKMAEAIAEEITSIVLTELDNNEIDVDSVGFCKDFILVSEAIKACIYRQFGIDHNLHNFTDKNIRVVEGDLMDMSPEEIRTKIENVIGELMEAKEKIDKSENK